MYQVYNGTQWITLEDEPIPLTIDGYTFQFYYTDIRVNTMELGDRILNVIISKNNNYYSFSLSKEDRFRIIAILFPLLQSEEYDIDFSDYAGGIDLYCSYSNRLYLLFEREQELLVMNIRASTINIPTGDIISLYDIPIKMNLIDATKLLEIIDDMECLLR